MLFYLPIALTALATTLYHVAQKSIVPGVHPMVSLVVTYATSLVACLAAIPFAPGGAVFVRSLKELNWATYVVGLSIVGVELASRSYFDVSTTPPRSCFEVAQRVRLSDVASPNQEATWAMRVTGETRWPSHAARNYDGTPTGS